MPINEYDDDYGNPDLISYLWQIFSDMFPTRSEFKRMIYQFAEKNRINLIIISVDEEAKLIRHLINLKFTPKR